MKAYAIKDPKGQIMFFTIDRSEEQSKKAFVNYRAYNWIYYQNEGYRCVPVLITEVKTEK